MIIFKYPLASKISMPTDAVVLSVANQNGRGVLWAMTQSPTPYSTREFVIVETDEEFEHEDGLKFIGTLLLNQGDYVVHVFEWVN